MHLTAHEVRSTTFPTVRFRDGYDQREVDEFMERVAVTLEHFSRGSARYASGDFRGQLQPTGVRAAAPEGAGGRVTSAEILETRFSATRFGRGYDMTAVDEFLDRAVAAVTAAVAEQSEPPS